MPPHGGHGHHGGGRHRHGGGGGWRGGWGPGWSGPGVWGAQPAYTELIVTSCPSTLDPVLASDGRTYTNPCLAREAGASVVKRVPASKVTGFGDVVAGVPNTALLVAAGVAAYFMFFRR